MSTVQDILNGKGGCVHCVVPEATALDAIRQMNEHKVGALVVAQGRRVVGMFTERDVLRRVVGEERPPSAVLIRDVMTTPVTCCEPGMDLNDVRMVMKTRRIRHLPVVVNDELIGLVSIGDVNAFYTEGQAQEIHMLHEYLYGRT
jgi:CBS domain-containing protein